MKQQMSEYENLMDDYRKVVRERDRLQRVLDSRPAINCALPDSYIQWSQSIYAMDMAHATESQQ